MFYAIMPSLSFILLMVSEKKNSEYIFSKITFYVTTSTKQMRVFGQTSYETWRTTQ